MIVVMFCLAIITPQQRVNTASAKSATEERAAEIESALFTRAEFFGAQAIIPLPTSEARARLAEVRRRYPQDAEITLKLAELDENLGDAEAAHKEILRYVGLEKSSLKSLEKLAEFYHRRARFAEEAATRERMIAAAPQNERASILRDLIGMARRHRLEKYQRPDFFHRLIASDPNSFAVVMEFVARLVGKKDYGEALRALRQHKPSFPDEKSYFLEKEVEALVALGRGSEAESLYIKSFDRED